MVLVASSRCRIRRLLFLFALGESVCFVVKGYWLYSTGAVSLHVSFGASVGLDHATVGYYKEIIHLAPHTLWLEDLFVMFVLVMIKIIIVS